MNAQSAARSTSSAASTASTATTDTDPQDRSSDRRNPRRTVAVMMPFGGTDTRLQRYFKLHFNRIRENIELLEREERELLEKEKQQKKKDVIDELSPRVGLERQDRTIDYRVDPFYTSVHSVPLEGLRAVVDADVLIALVGRQNVNVIYEVGIRQVVKGDVILLVEGNPRHELPLYLQNQGYIPYESPGPTVVGKAIEALSEIEFPTLITADFGERHKEIMGILRSLIEDKDADLRKKIGEALREIEFSVPNETPEINQLYRSVDPSRIVGAWDAYFPYCVTRIRWKRRSDKERYDPSDLIDEGGPVVCSANRAFENLVDIARAGGIPDPDSRHRVTLSDLADRLRDEGYVKKETFDAFIAEQQEVLERIVLDCETDWSTESLKLDGDRFHPFYDNACFKPAIFAKWTIGSLGGPHADYFLLGFIRTDHNGKPQLFESRLEEPLI